MIVAILTFVLPVLICYAAIIALLVAAYKNAHLVVFPIIGFCWGWYYNWFTSSAVKDGFILAGITLVVCVLLTRKTQTAIPFYLLCYSLILGLLLSFGLNTPLRMIIGILIMVVGTPIMLTKKREEENLFVPQPYEGPIVIMIIFRIIGGIFYFFTILILQSFIMTTMDRGFTGWERIALAYNFEEAIAEGLPWFFITILLTIITLAVQIVIDFKSKSNY